MEETGKKEKEKQMEEQKEQMKENEGEEGMVIDHKRIGGFQILADSYLPPFTHYYHMLPRISKRGLSTHPSVGPSVRPPVGSSVYGLRFR